MARFLQLIKKLTIGNPEKSININEATRHLTLDETQLLPEHHVCPICGNNLSPRRITTIQEYPPVHYLQCDKCKGCSASRMPTSKFLDNYYQDFFAKGHDKITFEGYPRFCKNILNYLLISFAQESFSILDFGGGDGTLSIHIAAMLLQRTNIQHVSICVVDYAKPALNTSANISLEHKKNLIEVTETYNLVIASAIIEHIPDLKTLLPVLLSKIKPNGYFYSRTPYSLPMRSLFKDYNMVFPAHVHDLGPEFWNHLLENFNIKGSYLYSRPSLIQTSFFKDPLTTMLAYLFKFPARLELYFSRNRNTTPYWKWVGGWEVLLKL